MFTSLNECVPAPQNQDANAPTSFPVRAVSDFHNADVFIYSGDINRPLAGNFIGEVEQACKRENAALVICTYGGDPDAAYIIARILKAHYKKFTLLVYGHCKSAGTLIALGANEIVMSNRGELGPLDVQVLKSDELFFRSSGLDITQAIVSLSERAYEVFEGHFINTIIRGGGAITTKTAADIATSLAVGMLSPITAQIDPLRVGEMERAINIAQKYGERLNDNPQRVERLIKEYPSHAFVIDFQEACSLFGNVRKPNDAELALEQYLRTLESGSGPLCISRPNEKGLIGYIEPEKVTNNEQSTGENTESTDKTTTSPQPIEQVRAATEQQSANGGEGTPVSKANAPTQSTNGKRRQSRV